MSDDLPPSKFAELLARDVAGEDITEGRPLEPVVWAKTKRKRKPPSQNPPKRRPPAAPISFEFKFI